MKKRLLGFLLGAMLISVCIGCGAKSTTTGQTETDAETTTAESTSEQTAEAATPSEKTIAPATEATEEPSEEIATETKTTEATPEATTEPTETVEAEQTEIPTPEPKAVYTYIDVSVTMYAQQTVNIRDLPDTSGNKLGSLSTNQEIAVTGQCNETGWYRFNYNGSEAYVSNKYLSDEKVEVQKPSDNSSGSSGSSNNTASNSCPYPLWQPVINGYSFTWYVIQPDPEFHTNGHFQTESQFAEMVRNNALADNVEWKYFTVLEWTYMGTYAEGDIYKQTWGISNEPDPWINQ